MRRAEREDGFTLIELMITVAIMGIIIIPLGNFVLAYFSNYTQTEARFSGSHDVQIAAAYFSQDVADSGLRAASAPYATQQSVWTAGTGFPASFCGQSVGTPVLLLRWDDWTVSQSGGVPTGTPSPPHSAAYVSAGGTLHRVYCDTGTTTSSNATVVHNYASGSVVCAPADCAASPSAIELHLTINSDGDVQDVTLRGQRRQTP